VQARRVNRPFGQGVGRPFGQSATIRVAVSCSALLDPTATPYPRKGQRGARLRLRGTTRSAFCRSRTRGGVCMIGPGRIVAGKARVPRSRPSVRFLSGLAPLSQDIKDIRKRARVGSGLITTAPQARHQSSRMTPPPARAAATSQRRRKLRCTHPAVSVAPTTASPHQPHGHHGWDADR
jgi:hypothetical protein